MNHIYKAKHRLLPMIQRLAISLAILMVFALSSAWSTHIVGGSISYRCMGNDQYEVTLTVRRDCILGAEDAPFDDPASVGIFDQNGNLVTELGDNGELLLPFIGDQTLNNEISQICYANQSSICVHITQYVGILELPMRDGGYTLSYQRCCRNASLNNVIDPLNTGMTLFIDITPDALSLCNNSPRFNFRPDIFICVGEQLSFDASAIDEEGDVLVYSLCAPFSGATREQPKPQPPGAPPYTPVAWSSGFDAENALGNDNFNVDQNTGAVTGTPGFAGQYLIGLCVEEYRNGVLLSITHREFQYNVVNCDEGQVVAEFEVSQNECGLDDISFINESTPGSNYTWFFDYPSDDPNFISNEESPSFSYPTPGRYSIRLIAQNPQTNCESIIDKDITISDGTESEFSTTILSCTASDELNIRLSDETGLDALERVWEVIVNGRLISGTSKSIEFTADRDAQITASLTVNGQTGCLISQSKQIDVNIDNQVKFAYELLSCETQVVNLRFSYQSVLEVDLIPSALNWSITRENGDVITRTGEEFELEVFENENLSISQSVSFTNGCIATQLKDIDLDLDGLAEFETVLQSCTPGERNQASVTFRAAPSDIPVDGTIISQEWMVVNGETEFNSTETEITLDLDFTSPVWVGHTVQYSNGCTANEERKISLNELFGGDVSINSSIENCNGDEVTVRFFNDGGRVEHNWAIILQKAWHITTADGTMIRSTGNSIEYTGAKGEIIEVYYIFNTNDGCAFEQIKTIVLGVDDAALNFTDQIIDCDGDQISIKLTDNRASDRTDWVIYVNGVQTNRSGREIIIRVNRDDSVKVKLQTDTTGACGEAGGKEITSNPDDLLSYSIDQIDCPLGGIELQFVDTSPSIGGAIKESVNWVFQTSDGQTVSATGSSTLQLFDANDVISIMMDVQYSNGCRATLVESLDLNFANFLSYDVELISCNAANQFSLEITANTDALPPSDPVSGIFWLITNGSTVTNESGNTVALDVDMDQPVDINLSVSYGNRCMFTLVRTLSVDDILGDGISDADDVDIRLSPISCNGQDVTLSINNMSSIVLDGTATIIRKEWEVIGPGVNLAFTGDAETITVPDGTELFISLFLELDNGCIFIINDTRTVRPYDSEAIDFTQVINSCSGENVNLTLTDNRTGQSSTSWILNINGVSSTRTGRSINLTVDKEDDVFARLNTGNVSGCDAILGEPIITDPGDLLTYSIDQIDCPIGQVQLQFVDTSPLIGGSNKESVSWRFETPDGQVFTDTGNSTLQTFTANQVIKLILEIQYSNGCLAIYSEDLDLNFANYLDYDVELLECNGPNQFSLILRADTDALPPSEPVSGIFWLVNNAGVANNESGESIELTVNLDQPVEINISISYGNRCMFTLTRFLTIDDILGDGIDNANDVDVTQTPISCDGNDVTISLSNNTAVVLSNSIRIINKQWTVRGEGIDISGQGNQINLTAPNGTELDISLRLELDNGCVFILRDTKTVSPLDEEAINFTEDILSCDGDNVTISLTDNNDASSTSTWIITINGQTSVRTGRVINLTVNKNDEVQARLDTGNVSGCEDIVGKDVIVNPDDVLTYEINQVACSGGAVELEFVDTSPSIGGAVKQSINWVFETSTSQVFSGTGASTTQSFPQNDLISVMLDVVYSNGCRGTITESVDLNFGNALDYDVRLISCNGPNQFTIELTANADGLPIDEPIVEYTWDVDNGANTVSEVGQVIQLDVNMNELVELALGISYDNGCEYSLIDELTFDDIFGDGIDREDDVQINIDPQVCGSDEITYSINNRTTFVLDNTARVISKEWKITAPGDAGSPGDQAPTQRNICENENTISILGQTVEAIPGATMCVPFNAYNFTEVGSIQTAFNWDPAVLTFSSFNEGALPDIDLNTGFVSSGELRMVWLVGFTTTQVTLEDNTTLFEICFDVAGATGSSTDISFTGIQNLAIEITNEDLQIVDACLQAAQVDVVSPSSGGGMTMITGTGDEISFTGNVGDEVNVMLTMELDNGCILMLNETFTVEEVDLEFFHDFPEITMSGGGNSGNQGGNGNGDGGANGSDGGNTGAGDGTGMNSSGDMGNGIGNGGEDAIIVVCDGQARPLISNPNPAWTYEWSPMDGLIFDGDDRSNPLALPSQTTTYTVLVTAGECTTTGQITVIPADEYTFSITNGGIDACNGEVNLSVAAAPGARVEWSLDPAFNNVFTTGSTLSTTQNNVSVSYYVRQIFEGGCVSPIQSFTIENLSLDITGVTIDPITNESELPVCGSSLVTINATTNGNPANIQWIDQATNAVIGTGPSIEVDATQVMNIRAALDGGNGCIVNTDDTALVPYDVNDDISIDDSDIPQVFCTGLDTPISLAITGNSDLQFSWAPDPCIVEGGATSSPVINASANKDLIVTVTNLSTGCTDQLTIPIRISDDDMTFEITGDADICGDGANLMASPIEGASVEWSLDESFTTILAEGNQLSTMQEDINQTYYARQLLAGGCFSNIESYTVTKNDIVIDGLNTETNTLAFCGDEATTSITAASNAGAENIMWFDANTDQLIGTGSPLDVDPLVVNMIYGTVVGASGCESRTETITLIPFNIDDILDLNLGETGGIPDGVCSGESTPLNVTNLTDLELIYEWGPTGAIESGGNTASPIINITEETEFTLRVTNPETGCVIEVQIPIAISDPMLELFADPSAQIYLGSDVEILAETDAENPTYTWSTGETTPTITVEPTEDTSYTVTITDENGCSVVETIDITVMTDCSGSGIFLPNAFTPNGDGSNDELFVRTNSLRDVSLVVFDRWGREVFQTNNKDIGWNGRWQNDGDQLPPDAYGYILTAVCFTGEEYSQQGNVSILR